jgi:Tfp pilus assembly protein PilV
MNIAENNNNKITNKKLVFVGLISVLLFTGGLLGWIKFQQEQKKKIQQSQALLTQACQTDISANSNFLDASKKVNQATKLLYSVPNIPGLGYQEAQSGLNNFSTCIKTINAKENFFEAKRLSKKALLFDAEMTFSVQYWEGMRSDLEKSINLLKTIPNDVNTYAQSQKTLKLYQNKFQKVNQRLQQEQAAVNAFNRAEDLKNQADQLTRNSPNLETLNEAESKVKEAIQIIKTIPQGTTVSQKSQDTRLIYQDKIEGIRYLIGSRFLEPLVKLFSKFADSLNNKTEYQDYANKVNNLNKKLAEMIKEAPVTKNHPSTKALKSALNRYNDALIVWQYCQQGKCQNSLSAGIIEFRNVLWIPDSFKIKNVPLVKKYKVKESSNIFTQKFLQLNQVRSAIWEQAKSDIQEAQGEI